MVENRDIDWTPVHVESRRGYSLAIIVAIFAIAFGVALLFGLGVWRIA